MDDQDRQPLDPGRARIIDSIYEVVLRPEHYDSFMVDWAAHVERAAERLSSLRITSGAAPGVIEDPLIEGHFRRAFAMLERMGRQPEKASAAVPGDGAAALLRFDGAGQPLAAEDEGLRLFGQVTSAETVAQALDAESAQRLRAMMAALARAPAPGQFAVLALTRDEDTGPMLLAARTRRLEGRVVLEIGMLTLRWSEAVDAVLADSFQLTRRETQLVQALATTGDLASIAGVTGRSLHTLRSQIKSVFQKTRTSSQTDLMRLVAALVQYGVPGSVPGVARGALDWGEVVSVALPDGRVMPVHRIGPREGQPVVFIHGMLDGIAVTRRIGDALGAHRLQLVAPIRPNFGQAPADARITEAPEVFARDLGAVVAALEISRPVLMGHMAGALYAFAAAGRLDGQVAGIVNVSGGVPIRSVRQFRAMTPRQRAVAYTARFAPALLPAILRAGIAQIDGRNAVQFMNALYPAGSRDRDLVADPAIAGAIIDGYRFSVAQGEQAFRIDSWHVTRDWSALVERSRCPVLLVHGALDPVVAAESVRAFARDTARVTLHEVPGEGQLLLYSTPRKVLALVAGFIDAQG